jgi:hypothetical protein
VEAEQRLRESEFPRPTIAEARRMAAGIEDDPNELDVQIRRAEAQLEEHRHLAADSGSRALVEKVKEIETELGAAARQGALGGARGAQGPPYHLTEDDLRKTLLATAVRRRGDDVDVEWGWAGLGSLTDLTHQELAPHPDDAGRAHRAGPRHPRVRDPLPPAGYRS